MNNSFHVIGIGASAGGLKAIRTFLQALPEDFNDPIIYVQHQSPSHKSHMRDLLEKCTSLNVVEVYEPTEIRKGHLYLMMPNTSLSVEEQRLIPHERKNIPFINHPINQFLSSLAINFQEKAIGIILSGTGTDGASGLLSIDEFGGMVMAQRPEDAEFNGMPIAAVGTNTAKYVLPANELAQKVGQINRFFDTAMTLEQEVMNDYEGFDKILLLINLFTNRDFTGYKKATLVRRIAKRIVQFDFKTLEQYIAYFEKTHAEAIWLSEDFLIGVTSFFRDPDVWKILEKNILPQLIENVEKNKPLKISCIGCSTGEEPFSLAMAIELLIADLPQKPNYKIFCSDLSTKRVSVASKGIYPKRVLEDIPKKYHKFFKPEGSDSVVVANTVREHLIFSNYNYLTASPMTNMDMVLCRNVLIYLQPELQEKMTKMFRFSLKTGGILLLGQSESILKKNGHFNVIDENLSIYSNVQKTIYVPNNYQKQDKKPIKQNLDVLAVQKLETANNTFGFLPNLLNDSLIEELNLAVIYSNSTGNIIKASGDFRRFLQLPKSGFSNNLFDLLPVGFVPTMINAIKTTTTQQKKTKIDNVNLPQMEAEESVDVICVPYFEKENAKNVLVIFMPALNRSTENTVKIKHVEGLEKEGIISKLNEDLKVANLEIASLRNQIDVNSEELQTSNEELMATNEELQSTNEELQSVNQELYAVNSELNQKIIEFTQASDDIDNLINSTRIEVIVIDKQLLIRKTTPFIHKHFDITDKDVGQPLFRYTHKFHRAASDLMELCQKAIDSGEQSQKELQNIEGKWFIQRVSPFLDSKKAIDGAIISYVEITEMKLLHESNRELERFAYVASHDLQEPLRNILDFIQLLKTEYKSSLDKTAMEYLGFMDKAAGRMGDLIKDVLAYSRIGVRGEGSPIDLDRTVKNVLEDLDLRIKKRKAKISIKGKLPKVKGHEVEFHSLFLNLLSNALKFVPVDKTPEIIISTTKKDNNYLFSVADNGIGIGPENQSKVFQIFKKLHSTDDFPGTGIGLAHCKKIVELNKGTLWLESELDKGTTFYFTLSP